MWPVVYGVTMVVFSQLWQLDRMRLLYDELEKERPSTPEDQFATAAGAQALERTDW